MEYQTPWTAVRYRTGWATAEHQSALWTGYYWNSYPKGYSFDDFLLLTAAGLLLHCNQMDSLDLLLHATHAVPAAQRHVLGGSWASLQKTVSWTPGKNQGYPLYFFFSS